MNKKINRWMMGITLMMLGFSSLCGEEAVKQEADKKDVNAEVFQNFRDVNLFSWHEYWIKHGKTEEETLELIRRDVNEKATPEDIQQVLKKAKENKWVPQDVEAAKKLHASQVVREFPEEGIKLLKETADWILKNSPNRKDLLAETFNAITTGYLKLNNDKMAHQFLTEAINYNDDDMYRLNRAAIRMYLFNEKGCEEDLEVVRKRTPGSEDLKFFEQKIPEWRKNRETRRSVQEAARAKEDAEKALYELPINEAVELYRNRKITPDDFFYKLMPRYTFYLIAMNSDDKDSSENQNGSYLTIKDSRDNTSSLALYTTREMAESELKDYPGSRVQETKLFVVLKDEKMKQYMLILDKNDGQIIPEEIISNLKTNYTDILKASGISVDQGQKQ